MTSRKSVPAVVLGPAVIVLALAAMGCQQAPKIGDPYRGRPPPSKPGLMPGLQSS